MKYEVNGYKIEGLDLVEKDGNEVFLCESCDISGITKLTVKEALEFAKKRIQNGKNLTVTGWTYDAGDGVFVGKLKRNKRGATAIRAELHKVTQRKITKKEAENAIKIKETT